LEKDEEQMSTRAEQVLQQIYVTAGNMTANSMRLGGLLVEAKELKHYRAWGFTGFVKWLLGSGLGIKERQAEYFMNAYRRTRDMGLKPEDLDNLGMTRLRHIFTLNPSTEGDAIRALLSAASSMPVSEVINSVRKLKNKSCSTTISFVVNEHQYKEIRNKLKTVQEKFSCTPATALVILCQENQ
jgi:hypothetical protein